MQFQIGNNEIEVNIATRAKLLAQVSERFHTQQGFALATINLDHLVKLSASPEFRRAYMAQDFVVADGNPIVWLSRIARRPVELQPGSDLVLPLAELAARSGVAVALIGSTKTTLQRAAESLAAQVPGLQISLQIAPDFGFDPHGEAAADALAEINRSGAGLCFLALGAPKQEIFAARGRTACPKVGFASIGAGLDFLAGTQKRAPRIVRALAAEWLWRAATSPLRLGPRYIRSALIMPGLMRAALKQRFRS